MSSSVPCASPYAPPHRDQHILPFHGIRLQSPATSAEYQYVLTSTPCPGVGQIILNRPKALNALSTPLMTEPNNAIRTFAATPEIGAVMLTGSGEAFAAGADIMEVKDLTSAFSSDFIALWPDPSTPPIPIIAAVNGYALAVAASSP